MPLAVIMIFFVIYSANAKTANAMNKCRCCIKSSLRKIKPPSAIYFFSGG